MGTVLVKVSSPAVPADSGPASLPSLVERSGEPDPRRELSLSRRDPEARPSLPR